MEQRVDRGDMSKEWVVRGLTNGRTYAFRARARNANGWYVRRWSGEYARANQLHGRALLLSFYDAPLFLARLKHPFPAPLPLAAL